MAKFWGLLLDILGEAEHGDGGQISRLVQHTGLPLAAVEIDQRNMCFVFRRDGDSFGVIKSGAAMRELTSGYTTCLLTSSLFEMFPFSTHIGWGVGFDIVSAHRKALRAIQESRRDTLRLLSLYYTVFASLIT